MGRKCYWQQVKPAVKELPRYQILVSNAYDIYLGQDLGQSHGLFKFLHPATFFLDTQSRVTTRPIPYLHQTSSVLRRSPLELLSAVDQYCWNNLLHLQLSY